MNIATNVAIIGAGQGGTSLMEIFHDDALVWIIGIAEISIREVPLGGVENASNARDASQPMSG